MKASTLLLYLTLILVILVFTASYHGLSPISLNVVAGYSMYPELKPGCIIVGVATWISGFTVNDIVVYSRSLGDQVVHRVISIQDGIVVTKGDLNPNPDPPVEASLVKYKVISHVPLYIWLPAATAIFIAIWGRLWRRPSLYLIPLLLLLAFYTGIACIGSELPPQPIKLKIPVVELQGTFISSDFSTITISYNLGGFSIKAVEYCVLSHGVYQWTCTAIVNGSKIHISIPREAYYAIMESRVNRLQVSLALDLDKGRLNGSYIVHVTWPAPRVYLAGNTLFIENPTSLPIEANITIASTREGLTKMLHVVVNATSTYTLTLKPGTYTIVRYSYMGEVYVWSNRV